MPHEMTFFITNEPLFRTKFSIFRNRFKVHQIPPLTDKLQKQDKYHCLALFISFIMRPT